MKILYLSDSILPSKSANSVHVMRMCEAFSELGHEVCLVGIQGVSLEEPFSYYGISRVFQLKLFKLPNIPLKLFVKAFLSLKLINDFKPDFIFGRSYHSVALQTYFFNVRYGFESHDPVSSLKAHFRLSLRRIISTNKFTGLVVISDALKRLIRNELGEEIAIQVLHDGATLSENTEEVNIRQHRDETLQVGYFGTIGKGRGIDLLVKCAIKLPEVDFQVFGCTNEEFFQLYPNLPIAENTHFYGFVDPKFTQYLRSQCDVLLAPYQENIKIKSGKNTSTYMSPVKIFEYMASKRPIIASDLKVLREVLNDQNSILVQSDNIDLWVEAILNLQDSDLRDKISNIAFDNFIENYTWKKRAEKVLKILNHEHSNHYRPSG